MTLGLTACGGDGSGLPDNAISSGPTATTTGSAARPEPSGVLDEQWYRDDNHNIIPNVVETSIGRDPRGDSCVPGQCRLPEQTSLREVTDGQNTLIILDSSGSMAAPASPGRTKMQVAKQAIGDYVANTPRSLDRIGLEVYGHQGNNEQSGKAVSCRSAEVLQSVGNVNGDNVVDVLGRFRPTGWTPIEQALRTAQAEFVTGGGINEVILVSDGIETCGGDPIAAARALHQAGINVTTNVVGFDIGREADKQLLRRIAEAGDGDYVDANSGDQLSTYFTRLVEQRQQLASACICLTQNYKNVLTCQNGLYRDALLELRNRAVDAYQSGNRQRGDEITRIAAKVNTEGRRREQATVEDGEQTLQQIRQQIDAIGQRLNGGG